ncbi:hypothetical protein ABPG75_013587 [Micractinium tetrahymenae]
MSQTIAPAPALKQLRVPKKEAPVIAKESTGPFTAPLTPTGVADNSGSLSAESSTTDLLACGLFEDELDDLQQLLKAHSPKNMTSPNEKQ